MMERIISFCKKNKWYIVAGLLLLLCGVLLYVLVSHTHCEHDDWYRRYPFFLGGRAESLGDVFKAAWTHFHIDNAQLVCATWEFFYCSYLDSKTWFDVANSIVFMIFVLSSVYLMGHKDKVEDKSKSFWWRVVLFVVPFWFLCPTPGETLCWMCGSVDYLWMTTASMLFLCLWYRIKEKQKDVSKLAWVGYFILSVYLGMSNNFAVIRKAAVEFETQERVAGESSMKYSNLVALAVEGIMSYTTAPLRIATVIGGGSSVAFLYAVWILIKTIVWGDPVAGFPSLMVAILFLGGVQLLSLGIIGEYLGRVYTETKNRPVYFARTYNGERVNKQK